MRLKGDEVTPEYFHVLRVSPMMGRPFTAEDAVFLKSQYVILSYGLWKDMFGRDPGIVGKDVRLSGVNHRVIGIMPETFVVPGREARLWTPLTWTPDRATDDGRHNNNWDMVARLKPGVSIALAQQRIDALNRRSVENAGKLRKLLENARFGTGGRRGEPRVRATFARRTQASIMIRQRRISLGPATTHLPSGGAEPCSTTSALGELSRRNRRLT